MLNRKSRSNRSSSSGVNNRCSGVKCSPMIRVRSSTADPRASCAFMQDGSPAGQLQQQQQQQQQLMTSSVDHEVDPDCATPPPSLAPQHSSSQYQFSYDYDVSSSQSHSSSGQSSREESSPTPNSQTPMTVSCWKNQEKILFRMLSSLPPNRYLLNLDLYSFFSSLRSTRFYLFSNRFSGQITHSHPPPPSTPFIIVLSPATSTLQDFSFVRSSTSTSRYTRRQCLAH